MIEYDKVTQKLGKARSCIGILAELHMELLYTICLLRTSQNGNGRQKSRLTLEILLFVSILLETCNNGDEPSDKLILLPFSQAILGSRKSIAKFCVNIFINSARLIFTTIWTQIAAIDLLMLIAS